MAVSSTITGSFTGLGQSEEAIVTRKRYNFSVWGSFTGEVQLRRSFDDGATWLIVKSVTTPYEGVGIEVEAGVLYHVAMTQFTSGEAFYRLGLTRL